MRLTPNGTSAEILSGLGRIPHARRLQLIGALLAGGALGACSAGGGSASKPTVDQAQRETASRLFKPLPESPVSGGAPTDSSASGDSWHIVLQNFALDEAGIAAAQRALDQVRTIGQLPGAYVEPRGERLVLAFGHFESLEDPRARQELDRVRAISVEGEHPYGRAVLGPPAQQIVKGSIPEYDLRNAKRTFGNDALYTLQVAIYGRLDRSTPGEAELAEYRAAAENAVYELRRQGEQAFYFHSPQRSMVTVGIFGPADHDPMAPGNESPALKLARKNHPYNLHNGTGIKESLSTRSGRNADRLQPSLLVAVPQG